MKTGDLISSLAKQTGTELSEEQSKVIQEITQEIPDEVANHIKTNLFTKESALANPDIINKLKAESLDAVDGKLKDMAKDLGLDDGFIHNLGEIKGTYNRMDSVKKAVLESHKTALLNKETKGGDLQDEIANLNKELANLKDTTIGKQDHDDVVKTYEDNLKDHANRMLNLQTEGLFSNSKWAMDISPEANLQTAMGLFNSELQNKELSLVNTNGHLSLQTKEGSEYYVENKAITPQEFASNLLAGHKLLKVSEANQTAPTVVSTTIDAGLMEAVNQANQINADVQQLGEEIK